MSVFDHGGSSEAPDRDLRAAGSRHPDRSPAAPVMAQDGLYFLHIPKTAGTSVGRYVDQTFQAGEICPVWSWDQIVAIPRDRLDRYRVFRGHFQGHLTSFLQRKLTMFTVLRDPVERTVSCYSYHRSSPGNPFHRQAMSCSLKDYCLHPATRWRIEDYQTICLLTTLWSDGVHANRDYRSTFGRRYPLHLAVEATTARGLPPDVVFELAKVALTGFAAVGISELLPDSLKLFSERLGVPEIREPIHEHRTRGRLPTAKLDADTRRTIEDLTRTDRLVYEYARKGLLETIAQQSQRSGERALDAGTPHTQLAGDGAQRPAVDRVPSWSNVLNAFAARCRNLLSVRRRARLFQRRD